MLIFQLDDGNIYLVNLCSVGCVSVSPEEKCDRWQVRDLVHGHPWYPWYPWYLTCLLSAMASVETLHCSLRGPQNLLAAFQLFPKCSGSRAPVGFNSPVPQAGRGAESHWHSQMANGSAPTPIPASLAIDEEAEHYSELSRSWQTLSAPVSC